MRRSLVLEPEPQSVPRARALVRETLRAAGADAAIDDASLLVSELVTNVVLHAGTLMALTVDVREEPDHGVRIEVLDHNPRLPQQRDYGATAATGRGLQLLAALADDFGIDELPGRGKALWFTLLEGEDTPPTDPAEMDDHPAPEGTATSEPASAEAAVAGNVRLGRAPVALFRTWQAHADALLREFTLASYSGETDVGALDELTIAHAAAAALFDQVSPVLEGADATFADLDLRVDDGEAAGFVVLDQVLTHAAQLAGQGRLLVPPSQPEIARLRHWACTQCSAQALGAGADAWDPTAHLDDEPLGLPPDYDPTEVRASDRALIAADETNRILAVSPGAARLLRWVGAELEGLRLVVVIPEALREAHVAGFVRHLLTGESRRLGHPMRVSALRRDGSEVPIDLVLSRTESRDGRTIFLGELLEA